MSATRFPDFLIVGAMKAGTTTVFRDLATNPAVFFPLDKEPGNLETDAVLTPAGRAEYAAMFSAARTDQVCGEASTTYTKQPEFEGAAGRARELCGPDLSVIYSVREPVARIVSQHHHELLLGEVPADIDRAVREVPRLVGYSRYASQITPWIEAFGSERVRVVRFEDYVSDRPAGASSLCAFLGIAPRPDLVNPDAVFNRSQGKPVDRGVFNRLRQTAPYRRLIRPFVSTELRDRFRHVLLPKAAPRPDPPKPETVDRIIDAVADDAERLRVIMGRAEPVWDLEAIRQKHHARAAGDA